MKRKLKLALCAAAVFLIGAWLSYRTCVHIFSGAAAFSGADQIRLSILTGDTVRELSLWRDEDGEGYFFLPAYADLSCCCFVYNDSERRLFLDGEALESKEFLAGFLTETPYTLIFQDSEGDTCRMNVTFLRSEGLPAIYLDTESGSLDYVHEDKENREDARMEIVEASGRVAYDEAVTVKGHGNTSWTDFEKKPYLIKLADERSLLGMDGGNKWVLFANGYDPSYIRNSLAYGLAEAAGLPYTSQLRYVDLYVNGDYRGNYQLVEKIDVGSGRVDIQNLQRENAKVNDENYRENERFDDGGIVKGIEDMENPDDITGGYLLERNRGRKYHSKVSGFVTQAGEPFVVRSPSYASREEIAYIANVVQHIENAILAPDGVDGETGLHYSELIDEDSFVKKYVMEEAILNEAQGATSSWFYKPENAKGTKLYAGPVWDYDKAFGALDSYPGPRSLSKLYCYGQGEAKWFYALYDKESFLSKVKETYRDIFLPELMRMRDEEVDRCTQEIRRSVSMDLIRWNKADNLDEDAAYIKEWLDDRIDFLNEVWIEGREVCLVRYRNNRNFVCFFESVPVGGSLENAPEIDLDNMVCLLVYDEEEDRYTEIEEPDIAPEALDFIGWYDKEHETFYVEGDGQGITQDILLHPVYVIRDA